MIKKISGLKSKWLWTIENTQMINNDPTHIEVFFKTILLYSTWKLNFDCVSFFPFYRMYQII